MGGSVLDIYKAPYGTDYARTAHARTDYAPVGH